jgi:DNA-binding CsgD family transcriptional regulator
MFAALGMHAFAERARREPRATGATARRRTADPRDQLTSQEDQIVLLARTGMSNPEIAAQLFLSARTVQYHLRKVSSSSRSAPATISGKDCPTAPAPGSWSGLERSTRTRASLARCDAPAPG